MITFNPKSYDGFDILCRVYKNQNPNFWSNPEWDEKEQISVEVLFNNKMRRKGKRGSCWLPRGAAAFIAKHIKQYKGKNKNIAICNELDDNIGVLTSCRENFDIRMRQEIEDIK